MIDRQTEIPSKFSPQKCPVCNGFGSLKYGTITCHACKGKGYVVINNDTGLPVDEIDRKKDENKNNTH